jgi:hypothetical protein
MTGPEVEHDGEEGEADDGDGTVSDKGCTAQGPSSRQR